MSETETQAKRVIGRFPGGVAEVAAIAGITVNAVYRWDYPPEKGGCGGRIPSGYQQKLLTAAQDRGYPLTANDFFNNPSDAGGNSHILHDASKAD